MSCGYAPGYVQSSRLYGDAQTDETISMCLRHCLMLSGADSYAPTLWYHFASAGGSPGNKSNIGTVLFNVEGMSEDPRWVKL